MSALKTGLAKGTLYVRFQSNMRRLNQRKRDEISGQIARALVKKPINEKNKTNY